LYRNGGDWDLLISSDSYPIAYKFLSKNPGEIYIDVYTDKKIISNDVLYLPEKLSHSVLKNRIRFGEIFIPSPNDYFISYSYHLVVHKKTISGLQNENQNSNILNTEINTKLYLRKLMINSDFEIPDLSLDGLRNFLISLELL
jgi:hypothetical protein